MWEFVHAYCGCQLEGCGGVARVPCSVAGAQLESPWCFFFLEGTLAAIWQLWGGNEHGASDGSNGDFAWDLMTVASQGETIYNQWHRNKIIFFNGI